jgi:hypothetical protein
VSVSALFELRKRLDAISELFLGLIGQVGVSLDIGIHPRSVDGFAAL